MVKRAIITNEKFRISSPGVDVDTAADHQFILHEQHLSAQPYYTEWVVCPFAGAGAGSLNATVPIIGPPVVLPNTQIVFYVQGSSGNSYYPANIAPSPTGIVDAWYASVKGNLATKIGLAVEFGKTGNSSAPSGAWLIYLRAPDP